jgi:hypothetical protein
VHDVKSRLGNFVTVARQLVQIAALERGKPEAFDAGTDSLTGLF